ncbi:hypothetical protein JRC04_22970 [Mycolicibacterium sp. S2-37]|uniref:hypothetical protein n=1 Tax=Mycolicibacterium sp. S2-37 TaxID=2810297 RepID=UPI001A942192|nr:hypothetical protein [Mycolicibacterium sp. S2-37]MBO0680338.1 hypothetical protein [Mycolicibacterium sp. S2-37]
MTMEGIGPQFPNDKRGLLTFEWLPADLQNAEDATQAADHERFGQRAERDAIGRGAFRRPATPAERALLQHLGYSLPTQLWTLVNYPSAGIRYRRWSQLENQTPNTEEES